MLESCSDGRSWKTMDAIRNFAAKDIDKAVVESGAVAALLDFDSDVHHCGVIEAVLTARRNQQHTRCSPREGGNANCLRNLDAVARRCPPIAGTGN